MPDPGIVMQPGERNTGKVCLGINHRLGWAEVERHGGLRPNRWSPAVTLVPQLSDVPGVLTQKERLQA